MYTKMKKRKVNVSSEARSDQRGHLLLYTDSSVLLAASLPQMETPVTHISSAVW
jgi:hypothetical protein